MSLKKMNLFTLKPCSDERLNGFNTLSPDHVYIRFTFYRKNPHHVYIRLNKKCYNCHIMKATNFRFGFTI